MANVGDPCLIQGGILSLPLYGCKRRFGYTIWVARAVLTSTPSFCLLDAKSGRSILALLPPDHPPVSRCKPPRRRPRLSVSSGVVSEQIAARVYTRMRCRAPLIHADDVPTRKTSNALAVSSTDRVADTQLCQSWVICLGVAATFSSLFVLISLRDLISENNVA